MKLYENLYVALGTTSSPYKVTDKSFLHHNHGNAQKTTKIRDQHTPTFYFSIKSHEILYLASRINKWSIPGDGQDIAPP